MLPLSGPSVTQLVTFAVTLSLILQHDPPAWIPAEGWINLTSWTCDFLRILGFQIAPHLVGSYVISWLQIGPPTSQKSITKLTHIGSPLKIGPGPQKETSIPTIHFQMRKCQFLLNFQSMFSSEICGSEIPSRPNQLGNFFPANRMTHYFNQIKR